MKNLTLLYAEDDVEVLEDTIYLLKPYFEKIYSAKDGEEALKLYYESRPDVVFLDINMPRLSGVQVASKIREKDIETPIVMITAYSDRENLIDSINNNVSAYVVKPFKMDEIINVIEKLTSQSKKRKNPESGLGFKWDAVAQTLFYKEEKIALTKNEIALMNVLLKNANKIHNVEELSKELFKNVKKELETNSVTQLISRFKKKVSDQLGSEEFFIENVYGAGYKINQSLI